MNSIQHLEDFMRSNFQIYKDTVYFLDTQQQWKDLISALENFWIPVKFPLLVKKKIQSSPSPAVSLLGELYTRQCPVAIFCNVLKNCEFLEILSRIAEPELVRIIQQPGNLNGEFLQEIYVEEGDTLTLTCKAFGLPPPSYLWRFGNIDLDQTGPQLCITNFMEDDVGEYCCVISQHINNEVIDVITDSVTVNLMPEAPLFVKDLDLQITVREGRSVKFKVDVRARPAATFEWMIKNEILELNSNNFEIRKLRASDAGTVTCIATNYIGGKKCSVSSNTCMLNVISSPTQPTAKMALLIANQEYDYLPKLKAPINDVVMLAEKLREMDFHVFTLCNLTCIEMKNACKMFFRLVPEGAYALVFFGGHGCKIGDPFMLPVDCPEDTYTLNTSLSKTELMKYAMDASPRLIFILADMCLFQPRIEEDKKMVDFITQEPYDGGSDFIVAYSTSEYRNAMELKNKGLYVDVLCKYLADNKDISTILQKVQIEFQPMNLLQKPSMEQNLSYKYNLTDACVENKELNSEIGMFPNFKLTNIPLNFTRIQIKGSVDVCYHKNFMNIIDLVFSLPPIPNNWSVVASIPEELKKNEWSQSSNALVFTIYNIQKCKNLRGIVMSIHLKNERDEEVDNCIIEFPCPIILEHLSI